MTRNRRNAKRPRNQSRRTGIDGIQLAGIVIAVAVILAISWIAVSTGKPAGTPRQWSSPPPMAIDPSRDYLATVKMAAGGEFVIKLRADKAPITVNNFVFLAKQGYYDGVTFHRVLDGFMAQGGDPTGTGGGGPGYEFANEDSDLQFDRPGVVAMANAGRDTNGSQFFITFGPQPRLNGDYTIFGEVVSGMETVNGLTRRDPDQKSIVPRRHRPERRDQRGLGRAGVESSERGPAVPMHR